MNPTKAAKHDERRHPAPSREAPQGRTYGPRQPEHLTESTAPLDRYLGNSYVQALAGKKQRLQTRFKVNESGESYEREADRVADQLLATPAHHEVSGAAPRIRRLSGQSHGQVDEAPANVGQALTSPGSPLEPALRQDMEQRFGYDFSTVRLHTGSAAEQSAEDMNAHAYTVGHNIVLGAGRFAPETHAGRSLLAHELTHVVHQAERGKPSIQRKEKEGEPNAATVTQIVVEAKTTGAGRGRALTSDGQTLLLNIGANNLSAGRVTTGKPLLGSNSDDWREIHLGSMHANLFVFDLPPGVTIGQTLTIIVEPTAKERAQGTIGALKKHTRDFVTGDGRRKASDQDLLKAASAGRILDRYGVTEDELLLLEQRRFDLREIGVQQAEYADLEDWALSHVGLREQAKAAEQSNATTLLQASQRLSLASLNLYQQDPLLELVDPRSRISALATANAIRFKETRPMRGSSEKVETPFGDLGDLRTTLQTFENALVADLRALATTFLNDTEVRLIRMQRQFVGRGDKQWGPGYLEREIEKVKQDPDVIEVLKKHEAYVKVMDQAELDDLKYNMAHVSAEDVDVEDFLYRERQKERQKERKNEKERHDKLLRETVARKSKLKLSPGFDVGDILSANGGRRAQAMLSDSIVSGRAKVREAREKLSEPKFLYAADLVIAKEKEFLNQALAAGSNCNRFQEGTLEYAFCKGFVAKRRDTVNWIIDKLARERRAQTTIWQDIVKVFEFAANFIPGPIGWATRFAVAAANFDQQIGAAREQGLLYNAGMSDVAHDPNAASSALLQFGVQVATDFPFSSTAKRATQLTLGLEKNLAGDAARLGEQGVATAGKRELAQLGDETAMAGQRGLTRAPETQVIKPPIPPEVPPKLKRELDPDKLFQKPAVNNTDIDRAAQKREAAKPQPRQQATEVSLATSRPVGNENVGALTDIEKAAQKRAAAMRQPQTQPQQQVLAATGTTGDVAPAKVIESANPQGSASKVQIVASGGGKPPERGTPVSGSVHSSETAAAPRPQTPSATRARGEFEDDPTNVDVFPAGASPEPPRPVNQNIIRRRPVEQAPPVPEAVLPVREAVPPPAPRQVNQNVIRRPPPEQAPPPPDVAPSAIMPPSSRQARSPDDFEDAPTLVRPRRQRAEPDPDYEPPPSLVRRSGRDTDENLTVASGEIAAPPSGTAPSATRPAREPLTVREGPQPQSGSPQPVREPAVSGEPSAQAPVSKTPQKLEKFDFRSLPVPEQYRNAKDKVQVFGTEVINWGSGAEAAQGLTTILRTNPEGARAYIENLRRMGVTREMARSWADFYRHEHQRAAALTRTHRVPMNKTPQSRVTLMDLIADLL